MTPEKFIEEFLIEDHRVNVGPTSAPPGGRRFSVVKSDAAKEACVTKDQGAFRLMKNQMVVFLRSKAGRFDAQFAGHAEVNANPVTAGEFEEHLFSPGFRPKKA